MRLHAPMIAATADPYQDILESADFFRALCEPVRLEVLSRVMMLGEADVGEIASSFSQDRSVISRHLQVLKDARVLTSTKQGRSVIYRADGVGVADRLRELADVVERVSPVCCPPS